MVVVAAEYDVVDDDDLDLTPDRPVSRGVGS